VLEADVFWFLGSAGRSALTIGLFDAYKYVHNIGMPCVCTLDLLEVNAMLANFTASHLTSDKY
jgi:hypothetical protein